MSLGKKVYSTFFLHPYLATADFSAFPKAHIYRKCIKLKNEIRPTPPNLLNPIAINIGNISILSMILQCNRYINNFINKQYFQNCLKYSNSKPQVVLVLITKYC